MDLSLFEDEIADIVEAATAVCGAEWLDLPNSRLGGRTPRVVIEMGREDLVRNVLRGIVYVGIS